MQIAERSGVAREVWALQSPGAMTRPNESTTNEAAPDPGASYARRLLHRWLIEYNPLYLLSAGLVLLGTFLCSRGLADQPSGHGPLGVAAVAELYAACLIGGAALLVRIDQRRPAVMLALLTVLYQWDLTLHTERGPYLGAWAAAAWLILFVAKVHALAWAMKIRLSRSAMAAAILAGAGLAFFPVGLQEISPRASGSLVAVWAFALVSLVRSAKVTSRVRLEGWPATVLARAARASAILSAALVAGHVMFWSSQWSVDLSALVVVAPLLLVRSVRSEARVWALVLGALVLAGVTSPAIFSVTALLAAAALVLRALSPLLPPVRVVAPPAARPEPPYRSSTASSPPEAPEVVATIVPETVDVSMIHRLLTGAAFVSYLSVWTVGWSSGPWPAHVLALDLALTALVLVAAWKARARLAFAPLLATYAHFVVQAGLLPAPRSLVEWGASAVGLGFVLLLASLATSYRLRATAR
ncbi:Hypothetical protein A7982_00634 [Minicystis rosea]|nr:Hypothetical protein A7982_00634 [Minicystis rosea]